MPVTWPAVPPVRLMGDLSLRGVRRAKSPRTTRSAPREQCPADLVERHFSVFRPNELWAADIPPQAGGAPPMHAPSLGAPMWCVKRRRVVSWLVVGRGGLYLGS